MSETRSTKLERSSKKKKNSSDVAYNQTAHDATDFKATSWKGKDKDITTCRKKKDSLLSVKTAQKDRPKSKSTVDNASSHTIDKSVKPVHDGSCVQVCKPKGQAKQLYHRTDSSSQNLSSDSHSSSIYTIKLSGLRLNVKQSRIKKLVEPFGNLAHVKILRYFDTGVCYAYVDYLQKSSAKKAVVELDKYELSGTKIHVCHKSDKHNCRQELEALNNPANFTIVDHHGVETESFTQEIADQNLSVSSSTVGSVNKNPTSCVDEMSSSDTGYRQSSEIYSIKLSGFRMNIKESEIEWLVKPFGDLNEPFEISHYPDAKISYALVNYKQKSSAEKAVSELDRIEFKNKKIHVCHQGELAVDHDCQNVLYAMNDPQDPIDNLNTGGCNFLEILKTKSIKFINHLALSSKLDFKNPLRSVTVSSYDCTTHKLTDECDTPNCATIEVTNLHPNVWFQELENHFESCGSPVSTCVHYYGNSCSAIVCYTSTEVASNVIEQFDGCDFHEHQIHVIKASSNDSKTRSSPVFNSPHTRADKEGASKVMQDPHVMMRKETKKEADTTSKKKKASLERYQVLVLIVCMPNLVESMKTSYKVAVTGFHEGSTCLNFKGDNSWMAYEYVMKHVELCKSKEFQCYSLATSLVAIAIKSIKKLGISVVMCSTDGKCLLSILENAKSVNIDTVVVHSLCVEEIDRAIGVLQDSPHTKNLRLLSKDIKDQLKEEIKRFQKKYLVSLQVLEEVVVILGYIEDDVIGVYEELEKVIEKLSQVTIEYNQEPREEMQFVKYRMFYKPTKQAKVLLDHLSESLSLKIQKTKRSFTLTGNPVATTEGIKYINQQLLENFQVKTFHHRCHPDFLQLIEEFIKEPIEKELDVVIYYFSVNGSEQVEPVKSIVIYVKVYSTDSTDFRKACDIIHKLKPQSTFYSLAEDEFEYVAEETVDLTRIGEPYRVMIVLQYQKVGVTLHAFTLKEAKHCFHALMQDILTALNLVNYIEVSTAQMNYLCSNKSDVIKSLNVNFETSANSHPKLKLEGKRSQVEKNTIKIQELLNRVVTRSHKVTYNNCITMWKKCWQDTKEKIVQDEDIYVELTTSSFEDNVTCELEVVGEVVQNVESAISTITKIDRKVRECNVFADVNGIEILKAGLAGGKVNVKKEIAYHIEIVQTDIIITTPYHMPIEEVKQTVEAYIFSEKEKLRIIRKSYEIQYSFLAKKLRSEWNIIQSFANDCKVNLVNDSHCAIEVEGKKIDVEQAEKQILGYILSLESNVNCFVLPVDSYCRLVLRSHELLHLCKELESESCISITLQMYPKVLLSAVVRQFNPSVTVQICEGNISLDRSNAFINFTDTNLTISEELKDTIGAAAAVDSERYLKRYGPQPAGKAVWSNSPTDGQKVIHAIIPEWVDGSSGEIDCIISAVCECLELAVTHDATSVSLPFLSCIDKNIPVKFLAECCLLAVHSFCNRSNFINRIRLVLPTEMIKTFVDEFTTGIFQQLLVANNDASLPGDSIWLWKDDHGEYKCYESKEIDILDKEFKTNPTCHLTIGRFTYKIDFSAMTQTNTSTQKVRSMQHDISDYKWMFKNSYKNWEFFSLQDSMKVETMYAKGNDFSMIIAGKTYVFRFSSMTRVNTQTNTRTDIKRVPTMSKSDEKESVSKILILGLNVEDAKVKIKSCIDSFCLKKSVNIPKKLVPYLSMHLKRIERDHKVTIDITASTALSIRYNIKGLKDNVQEAITAIYQTIAENGTLQSLQCYSRPEQWEPQSNAIELMNVPKGSNEWTKILNLMQKTLPKVKLISIQRIQNEYLWEKYCIHKERLGRKGPERVIEKELFHGTSNTPPQEIYKSEDGFDMRFSRDGMWGQGNYFAESARYSASGYSYQKKTTQPLLYLFSRTIIEKQIFLAKVLTGDSYRSHPDQTLRIPPIKSTSSSENIRYDTVNGVSNGDIIYITYSNDKAYPFYLITFTD